MPREIIIKAIFKDLSMKGVNDEFALKVDNLPELTTLLQKVYSRQVIKKAVGQGKEGIEGLQNFLSALALEKHANREKREQVLNVLSDIIFVFSAIENYGFSVDDVNELQALCDLKYDLDDEAPLRELLNKLEKGKITASENPQTVTEKLESFIDSKAVSKKQKTFMKKVLEDTLDNIADEIEEDKKQHTSGIHLFFGIEDAKDQLSEEFHGILDLTFDIADIENLGIILEQYESLDSGIFDETLLQSPSKAVIALKNILAAKGEAYLANSGKSELLKTEIDHLIEFLKIAAQELADEEPKEATQNPDEIAKGNDEVAGSLQLNDQESLEFTFGDLHAVLKLLHKLETGQQIESVPKQFKTVEVTKSIWFGFSSRIETTTVPVDYAAIAKLQNLLSEATLEGKKQFASVLAAFVNAPDNKKYLDVTRVEKLQEAKTAAIGFYESAKDAYETFQTEAKELPGHVGVPDNSTATVNLDNWLAIAKQVARLAGKLVTARQSPYIMGVNDKTAMRLQRAKDLRKQADEVVTEVTSAQTTITSNKKANPNYRPNYLAYTNILAKAAALSGKIADAFPAVKPKQVKAEAVAELAAAPAEQEKEAKPEWFARVEQTEIYARSTHDDKAKLKAKAKYAVSIPVEQSKQAVVAALDTLNNIVIKPYVNLAQESDNNKLPEALDDLEAAVASAKKQGFVDAELEEKVKNAKNAVNAAKDAVIGLKQDANGDDSAAVLELVNTAREAVAAAQAAVDTSFIDLDTEYATTITEQLLQAEVLLSKSGVSDSSNFLRYQKDIEKVSAIASKVHSHAAGEKTWGHSAPQIETFKRAVTKAETSVTDLKKKTLSAEIAAVLKQATRLAPNATTLLANSLDEGKEGVITSALDASHAWSAIVDAQPATSEVALFWSELDAAADKILAKLETHTLDASKEFVGSNTANLNQAFCALSKTRGSLQKSNTTVSTELMDLEGKLQGLLETYVDTLSDNSEDKDKTLAIQLEAIRRLAGQYEQESKKFPDVAKAYEDRRSAFDNAQGAAADAVNGLLTGFPEMESKTVAEARADRTVGFLAGKGKLYAGGMVAVVFITLLIMLAANDFDFSIFEPSSSGGTGGPVEGDGILGSSSAPEATALTMYQGPSTEALTEEIAEAAQSTLALRV